MPSFFMAQTANPYAKTLNRNDPVFKKALSKKPKKGMLYNKEGFFTKGGTKS
jgi:hypothetical protein